MKPETKQQIRKLILEHKAIIIGSRALGVSGKYSDWDIAIQLNDLPEELKGEREFETEKYFNVLPLGNSFLLKDVYDSEIKNDFDFIVFEKDKDLRILEVVINELKQLPKHYLKIKAVRIALFEAGLQHYGFVPNKK